MDRGVLEASELKIAFLGLEEEQGGSITTVQDLLKWTVIASAVKEGVVSLTNVFLAILAMEDVCALTIALNKPTPKSWSGATSFEGLGGRIVLSAVGRRSRPLLL